MGDFVHLHVHTEYSLLDGASRIDALVKKAKELKMNALAITDHGVMYGVIPFFQACKREGIKPIIGCEVYFTAGSRHERNNRQESKIYHLVLLAENQIGYENLMKIVSLAHLEGFYYKPRVDKEILKEFSKGLIALSGCLSGEVNDYLLQGQYEKAKEIALNYQAIFGENNFYLELQDHGLSEQHAINQTIIQLSKETRIPFVATNDVHYIEKEDAVIQDVLLAIGTGTTLDDPNRFKFPSKEFYLKSEKQMKEIKLFNEHPNGLIETQKIADRCNVEISLNQQILPKYPLPKGVSASEYLNVLAYKGLTKRFEKISSEIKSRFEYELSIIKEMGFSDYFLIVWDFMKFSHQAGIMTGPGRGSAAGSLVAYALGITNVNPIAFGLLFERFLNPERVNMPDIDIDFDYERRDEVIEYVSNKYGAEKVAQIITFGTFAAKAAIRDVGRVLGIAFFKVDKIAKLIPSRIGITIESAIKEVEELRKNYEKDEEVRRLLAIALKIEGMPRHHSTHAAGIVISDRALTAYTPIQKGHEDLSLSQYAMGALEEIGLLKMDFLGLRYLTIIKKTLDWIEISNNTKLDISKLDYNDTKTYQLLVSGNTRGIFQLESAGVKKVLQELKPSNFEDIVAILALYRPGPMEFISDYIKAKEGEIKITYPHDNLEPILKETYGIIVYQEQIMKIASIMAGFSLGEADLLRRAVGKKKREILNQERRHFVSGAKKNGYSDEEANRVYDLIIRFADYGFNRSHAVAYAMIAYQTAYLKANYPVQFMTALLSESMGNSAKIAEYIEESRKLGIDVLPPDILKSKYSFSIENNKIRFGFVAIKNIGIQMMESILKARHTAKNNSIIDYLMELDQKVINKRVLEALILSGAFDRFNIPRAMLMANLDDLIERIQKKRKLKDDLQIDFFDDLEFGETTDFDWIEVQEYSLQQLLNNEKEVLGVYLTGHPLQVYKHILERFVSHHYTQLETLNEGSSVILGGLILDIRTILTKKNEQMAFIQLEVDMQSLELIVFPRVFKEYKDQLIKGQGILVKGTLQDHDEGFKVIANKINLLSNINTTTSTIEKVYIKILEDTQDKETLVKLKQILLENPGNNPVFLYYYSTKKVIQLSRKFNVSINTDLKLALEQLLGENTFTTQKR